MSTGKIEQTINTQNQNTVNFSNDHIFLENNRFDEITLTNTLLSAENTVKQGQLVVKTGATSYDVLDVVANLTNVIGLLKSNEVILADDGTLDVNVCVKGIIAEDQIIFPDGVTLDTVIPSTNISLRDKLNSLGFHLESRVENTKFDN